MISDKIALFKGKITNLSLGTSSLQNTSTFKEYDFESFNINTAKSYGLIKLGKNNSIAYSKWISPKRTRSYPFASIFNTYRYGGKIVTIIPIIKDEGIGESKNKSNNDRINFITLSWMNLMNVYIILAWYDDARKKNEKRITAQKLNNEFVRKQLQKISAYKFDAHHWNNTHFTQDFKYVFEKAVDSYMRIAERFSVIMHSFQDHKNFLNQISSATNPSHIDLGKFASYTLIRSNLAAHREIATHHLLERLSHKTVKGIFELKNNLGGEYYLTADEVFFPNENSVIIQESKNSTSGMLPSPNDIKDGMFKLMLFSHLDELLLTENKKLNFSVQLKLTGKLKTSIELPASNNEIESFITKNNLIRYRKTFNFLQEEATLQNYKIILEPDYEAE